MSMTGHCFNNYWTSTKTYDALKDYIVLNIDGLRDTIVRLLGGEKQKIDPAAFTNDMVMFQIQDDVLTLLVHLGYLTYHFDTKEVSIPNYEIFEQFVSTVKMTDRSEVIRSLKTSGELLAATISDDAEKVAEMIAQSHLENPSILKYNDENSLACVIAPAYYSARANYEIIRELPAGKGFAVLPLTRSSRSSIRTASASIPARCFWWASATMKIRGIPVVSRMSPYKAVQEGFTS